MKKGTYFKGMLFAVVLGVGMMVGGSAAHAAVSISNEGFVATLMSPGVSNERGYLIQVNLQEFDNGQDPLGDIAGETFSIAYSIGTKDYANSFSDNPLVPNDGADDLMSGSSPDFQASIVLEPGENNVHLWSGRGIFGRTYNYLGFFTILYSTDKDYDIQLISTNEVGNSNYTLVVDVSEVNTAEEQVHYILNSLDISERVSMSKNFLFPTRYSSPSAISLRSGSNTIAVLVTDNDGNLASGLDSIKLFTVNYAISPIVDPDVFGGVGDLPEIVPIGAGDPDSEPQVDPGVDEPGDEVLVDDPTPQVDEPAEDDVLVDEDLAREQDEALERAQQELADKQEELAELRRQLEEELAMLDEITENANGGEDLNNDEVALQDSVREQLLEELADVRAESVQVNVEQAAIEEMMDDDEILSRDDNDFNPNEHEEENNYLVVIMGIVIALLLGVITGIVLKNKKSGSESSESEVV